MSNEMTSPENTRSMAELMQPVLDEIETVGESEDTSIELSTGFADLDQLLHGLNPGHLYVIGGAPGIGKSTLARDIARRSALYREHPTVVFTRQEPSSEVIKKVLSAETRVPLHVLRQGDLLDDDRTRIARKTNEITEAPLFVNNTVANIEQLIEEFNKIIANHSAKLLVIDNIQLFNTGMFDRYREIADISRTLKTLALDLGIAVIAVSSSNRDSRYRTDKRPQLGDLRDSGTIEDDADVVIFVHRDDYYDKESPRAGEADFIIAKNRHGATITVTVAAQLHLCRFVDILQ